MEVKKRIEYNMYNPEKGVPIPDSHFDALEESAMDRIMSQMSEGYTSGQLIENIRVDNNDPEDGVEYVGSFKVSNIEDEDKKFVLEETKENMFRANVIEFNWHNNDRTDIKETHIEALEESAMDRIFEMYSQGYTSGELFDNVFMNDDDIEDGEEGIGYQGYWSITPITPVMKNQQKEKKAKKKTNLKHR